LRWLLRSSSVAAPGGGRLPVGPAAASALAWRLRRALLLGAVRVPRVGASAAGLADAGAERSNPGFAAGLAAARRRGDGRSTRLLDGLDGLGAAWRCTSGEAAAITGATWRREERALGRAAAVRNERVLPLSLVLGVDGAGASGASATFARASGRRRSGRSARSGSDCGTSGASATASIRGRGFGFGGDRLACGGGGLATSGWGVGGGGLTRSGGFGLGLGGGLGFGIATAG